MRALATIRVIDSISPIENADAIEVAAIGGWNVVVKKGDFKVGDLVVYFEIDSWIPTELAPFLSKGKEPREFEGVKGERLRTIKLRGQISQGLILPVQDCITFAESFLPENEQGCSDYNIQEGDDFTDSLNVKKYEKPVNAQLAGIARGNFPSFIPKTDQERIQNLKRDLNDWSENELEFEVSEKVDGTSATFYRYDRLAEDGKEIYGVCSRNLDLKETEGNTYWQVARSGILDVLEKAGRTLAIQGEIAGPGIQSNQYQLPNVMFFVFDIFDISTQQYLTSEERQAFCKQYGLTHVPVFANIALFKEADETSKLFNETTTVENILNRAIGESKLNALYGSGQSTREGLVFKCLSDPSISFKAISNKWLLKYEE